MKNLLFLVGTLLVVAAATSCTPEKKKELNLNIATYNLRMDTPADSLDPWVKRKEMVKGLIRFHDFDIFGTQEGFKHQLDDLSESGEYTYVGAGRDDGKDAGEHSAIFYKTDKFEPVRNGDFWYSETPDVPGKGWDATCCNRICSWAEFKEKETGKTFFFFNSHYDHEGREARKNSSLLLLKKIDELASNGIVFVTGDFNATPDDEPIQIIYDNGGLKDSYQITRQPPYGTVSTFNAFRVNHRMGERIDYIWVTEGVTVNKYGTLNDIQYGHFPSDHYPVMVNVTF